MSSEVKSGLAYRCPPCKSSLPFSRVLHGPSALAASVLVAASLLGPLAHASTELLIELPAHLEKGAELRAFYEGQDASSYLQLGTAQPRFELPFPELKGTFQLRVEVVESGEVILDERFRVLDGEAVPAASEAAHVADETPDKGTEFIWSGQLDMSAQREAIDGSEFDAADTESAQDSELLAGLGFSTQGATWVSSVDLEFVHRKDRDNTLRIDAPKADMSRFVSSINYGSEQSARLAITAGDIGLSSENSLVNSGMNSRGLALSFESPSQRVRLQVGRLYGHDIVGLEGGVFGYDDDSHRMAANASVKLLSNDSIDWNLDLSMLDVDRGIEEQFGISASQSGEINEVRGVGTSVSLWQDRLTLSMHWADSQYDNPAENNAENLPEGDEFEVFNPGVTRGSAHRHALVWSAIQSEKMDVSVEFNQEQASAFYRSVQGQSTADRREWSLFSHVGAGPINASFGTTQYRNNLDELISVHTLDEAVHSVDLEFDLLSLGEQGGARNRFYPSALSVRSSQETLKTLNGEDIILAPVIEGFDFMNQSTISHGMSFYWEGESSSTSFDVDYSYFDNKQRERAEADSRDLVYGLSHDVDIGNWRVGGRLGLSLNEDLDTVSRSDTTLSEWGLSLAYNSETGLGFSAAVDQSDNDYLDKVLGEDEVNNSRTYSVNLELGAWVAKYWGERAEPSLSVSWSRSNTDNRSDYYNSDQTADAWLVNLGMQL